MSYTRHDLERDRGERWEHEMLGKDTAQRVVTMGSDVRDWRSRASGMEMTVEDRLMNDRFGEYVSRIGRDVLQLVSGVVEDEDVKVARLAAKKTAIEAKKRLLRREIKVAAMERGSDSTKIDEEWDTSSWSDEMVEDGVSVLFDVFYDQVTRRDEVRKNRASLMLEKLVNRHAIAESYVRKNVPLLVGLAANRFIKGGQSCGLLDLLFILHSARARYIPELSENNFAGRATDMCLLEARAGVMMIQHMVRSRTARINSKKRRKSTAGTLIGSFGSADESEILSEANLVGRAILLQTRWTNMHVWQNKDEKSTPLGFRGPVHIRSRYMMLILEINLTLVSESAGDMAQCNREEVLRCNGCILYSQMLGIPQGPFAPISAQTLSHVSKIAESLAPLLHSGCIRSAIRCIRYFQKTGKMVWADSGNKLRTLAAARVGAVPTSAEVAMEVARITFLDIFSMLINASSHAAAIHRARNGFDFSTLQNGTIESNDYRQTLFASESLLTEDHLKAHLGNRHVLVMLFDFIKEVSNLHITRGALRIIFNLACSDCYNNVLDDALACGGKNLSRLADFLEESDATVSSLTLGIFLQLSTRQVGRDGMFATFLASPLLEPRTKCTSVYTRRPYLRAILVAAAAIRSGSRRSYNPLQLPFLLADAEALRKLVYLDLLKSLKNPPLDQADAVSIPDLVLWPFSKSNTLRVSQNARQLGSQGVKDICDFLCHPTENQFFVALPWDESAAGCIILDGLSRDEETCRMMVSSSTIRYLSHCLYWGRLAIKDGPVMMEQQLLIILKGIISASTALGNMCKAAAGIPTLIDAIISGIHKVDVIFATSYFINTLSQNHLLVDEAVKNIQIKTGRSALLFFDCYSLLCIESEHIDAKRRQTLLMEMGEVGKVATAMLQTCRKVHGGTPAFPKLFDGLCRFIANLMSQKVIVELALGRWKITLALRDHLPMPLSALGDLGVEDRAYTEGLGMLPASFFDICYSLCALDKGKAACLVDGFLRRSIEKVLLLIPKLESPHELLGWTNALSRIHVDTLAGQEYSLDLLSTPNARFRPSPARLEVAAALRVVSRCATFANPMFGSANDVILDPEYNFVHVCKELISVEEAPRCDPVVVAAIQVLGGLSSDVYRVLPRFEALDILGLLAKQMSQVPLLPKDAVEACLNVANRLAVSGSAYVVDQLRNLREPLCKVNRVLPDLAKLTGETTWNTTLSTLKFERSSAREENQHHVNVEVSRAAEISANASFRQAAVEVPLHSTSLPSTVSVFDEDRILREQLQQLYAAAGLEEEAQRMSPSKQSLSSIATGSAASLKISKLSAISTTPSPSPTKGQGRLFLDSLNSPSSNSSKPSPSINSSSLGQGMGSPRSGLPSSPSPSPSPSSLTLCSPVTFSALGNSLLSPHKSSSRNDYSSADGLSAEPISSPVCLRSGSSRVQRGSSRKNVSPSKSGGGSSPASPIKVMSTWDMEELKWSRPSL